MTVPSNYDTDYLYTLLAGTITDVQDIIDQIVDDLTVNLPVDSRWTDLGSGVYQSPIQDPSGAARFMTVAISRVSATRIGWLVKDQVGGTTHSGTFDMTAGSVEARIYTGPYHAVCEIHNVGVSFQHGLAFLTDPGSFGYGSTITYVTARTSRDSGGSSFGSTGNDFWVMRDSGGASTPIARAAGFTLDPNAADQMTGTTTSGSIVAIPLEIASYSGGANVYFSGRAYQIICLPRNFAGTDIDVPLDEATIGTFRALALGSNPSGQANIVIAVRMG